MTSQILPENSMHHDPIAGPDGYVDPADYAIADFTVGECVKAAAFWGERCQVYLTYAQDAPTETEHAEWLACARRAALWAGTAGLIALGRPVGIGGDR